MKKKKQNQPKKNEKKNTFDDLSETTHVFKTVKITKTKSHSLLFNKINFVGNKWRQIIYYSSINISEVKLFKTTTHVKLYKEERL